MNILQINSQDIIGGAAKVSYSIKQGLENSGHTTSMFVNVKSSSDSNVFELPRSKARFVTSHLLGSDIDFFLSDAIMKTKEFKEADIIHCHNIYNHFFNLRTLEKICRTKPVVWTLHDMWAITPYCAHSFDDKPRQGFYSCQSMSTRSTIKKLNWRYLKWRKKIAYSRITPNIVCPSLWLENKVKKSILNDKPIRVIHNGIDDQIFKPLSKEACRKELGIPQDKKVILFSSTGGKNNIWKGWSYALQAVAPIKNQDDILVLCLGGNHDDNNSDGIRYDNLVKDDLTMARYYNAADIMLFTSLAENFPLSIIEAMACGLPIVSFDVGGVKEALTHGENGYLAKYRDSEDLTRGIRHLLSLDYNEINRMVATSTTKAKNNFTASIMTRRYIDLYHELLGTKTSK